MEINDFSILVFPIEIIAQINSYFYITLALFLFIYSLQKKLYCIFYNKEKIEELLYKKYSQEKKQK